MSLADPLSRRGLAALWIAAALTLGAAACGDGDEPAEPAGQPAPASPAEEEPPAGETPEPAPEPEPEPEPEEPQPEEPSDDSGGVSPPEPESGDDNGGSSGGVGPGQVDPNEPDSPGNDVAPEPGSPEDAFEQHCNANPEACT